MKGDKVTIVCMVKDTSKGQYFLKNIAVIDERALTYKRLTIKRRFDDKYDFVWKFRGIPKDNYQHILEHVYTYSSIIDIPLFKKTFFRLIHIENEPTIIADLI